MNDDRTENELPIPLWEHIILFTEEEVKLVNWDKVFDEW